MGAEFTYINAESNAASRNNSNVSEVAKQQQNAIPMGEPSGYYHPIRNSSSNVPFAQQQSQQPQQQQFQQPQYLGNNNIQMGGSYRRVIFATLPDGKGNIYQVDVNSITVAGKKTVTFTNPQTGETVAMEFKNEKKMERYLHEHLPCMICGDQGKKKSKTRPKKVAVGAFIGCACVGILFWPALLVCWIPFVIPQAYKKKYRCRKCKGRCH